MDESARFDRLAARYFQAGYRASPSAATELGIHDYDGLLDDLSESALKHYAGELKRFRSSLVRLNPAALPLSAATDRTLILADIEANLISLESICDWRRDPSYYVAAPLFSIFLLASRGFAPLARRVHNLTLRLEQLPDLLASGRANLQNPPHLLTEIAIEETQGAIDFCSTIVPSLAPRLPRTPRRLARAAARAAQALVDYLDFLRDDLMLVSTGPLGIGRSNFEALLRAEHMLPYSLEQLLRMAERVFRETEKELVEWARQIDRTKTWRALAAEAQRDYPPAPRLLSAYRREVAQLRDFVRERGLVTLPDEDCEVVETPPFDRPLNSYAAYVAPGPFEADQRGQFWVTPVDPRASRAEQAEQLQEHCNYLYPVTAAHESYPGHHVQLARANRLGSRWRKHFSSSLFAEGWALYCEELMDEAGYYRDPRNKLFQLKDRLWRAARVRLEIGLHNYDLLPDDAARFLVDKVGLTPTAARAEVRRYAAEPTQPLSYLIGELEVFRLRKKFRRLPQRAFHDRLLSSGTIPFALVEHEMESILLEVR